MCNMQKRQYHPPLSTLVHFRRTSIFVQADLYGNKSGVKCYKQVYFLYIFSKGRSIPLCSGALPVHDHTNICLHHHGQVQTSTVQKVALGFTTGQFVILVCAEQHRPQNYRSAISMSLCPSVYSTEAGSCCQHSFFLCFTSFHWQHSFFKYHSRTCVNHLYCRTTPAKTQSYNHRW